MTSLPSPPLLVAGLTGVGGYDTGEANTHEWEWIKSVALVFWDDSTSGDKNGDTLVLVADRVAAVERKCVDSLYTLPPQEQTWRAW